MILFELLLGRREASSQHAARDGRESPARGEAARVAMEMVESPARGEAVREKASPACSAPSPQTGALMNNYFYSRKAGGKEPGCSESE